MEHLALNFPALLCEILDIQSRLFSMVKKSAFGREFPDVIPPQAYSDFMNSLSEILEYIPGKTPTAKTGYRTIMSSSGNNRIYELPSYLDRDHFTNSLGDYCAKLNFIKEDYACMLGLKIDRQQRQDVAIGNGKNVTTTGVAQASFRFADEAESYPLTFHLLPSCIHDVILGKPFLKATRTFSVLTNFARRVKRRVLKGIKHYDLLYLGDCAPRFEGLINGMPQNALADSGAKVMVMDEDYAQSIGLSIDREHRTKLRFADGSNAYTSGMTYGVEWEFGGRGTSERYILDFHILKNAPARVILSDTFLFGAEAFSQYNCYLVDDDDDDDDAFFFAIDIDTKYLSQGSPTNASTADLQYFELVRRGEEADRIANLPRERQSAEWDIENERRAQWDQMQMIPQLYPPRSSQTVSISNTLSTSNATPASSSQGTQQQSSSSTLRTRFRLWFKLKRKRKRNDVT